MLQQLPPQSPARALRPDQSLPRGLCPSDGLRGQEGRAGCTYRKASTSTGHGGGGGCGPTPRPPNPPDLILGHCPDIRLTQAHRWDLCKSHASDSRAGECGQAVDRPSTLRPARRHGFVLGLRPWGLYPLAEMKKYRTWKERTKQTKHPNSEESSQAHLCKSPERSISVTSTTVGAGRTRVWSHLTTGSGEVEQDANAGCWRNARSLISAFRPVLHVCNRRVLRVYGGEACGFL